MAVAAAPWAWTEAMLDAAMQKISSDGVKQEQRKKTKKKAGYVKLWFLRGRVARRLSLSGKKLNVKGCTVSRLSGILPDSYDWQKKFCKIMGWDPDDTPVEKLFEQMEYKGMGPLIIWKWTYQGVGLRSGAGRGPPILLLIYIYIYICV